MKRAKKNPIGIRAIVLGIFFTLWMGVIGGKVVYLQVFKGDSLSKKASDQYETSVRTDGKRGVIYDRNRREMAVSTNATSIGAHPDKLSDVKKASSVLANALHVDPKDLAEKLSKKRSFVWVQRQVTPKESAAVSALQLKGIAFHSERKRYYPGRTRAAQVIGFTGVDGNGLHGIEYRYNNDLSGNSQRLKFLRDGKGNKFVSEDTDSVVVDGHDLVLTIDCRIQFLAEQALKETVETFSAESAMAVVMDPETGAVLAMAHYPSFNPNVFLEFEKWKWRNRAITDPFEPGSTMKIFTAAAAIEKGGVTPNSVFHCENGSFRVSDRTIHDTHDHGYLTLKNIIKHSSNIGAVKVLKRIGNETLYSTLREFGFGDKTGIDCPGETAGRLKPYEKWREVKAANISFGQGMSVSAIQLAAAVNAIANDGVLMRPYIVQALVDAEGDDVKRFEPEVVRRVVSFDTARVVTGMMEAVTTEGGTGEGVTLPGYSVAGKTGTAEKTNKNGAYAEGLYVSSFVGFVPADDPRATIVVIVDEPKEAHYGGTVAGPAFQKIAEGLLQYLNVPSEDFPTNILRQTTDQLTVSRENGVQG